MSLTCPHLGTDEIVQECWMIPAQVTFWSVMVILNK